MLVWMFNIVLITFHAIMNFSTGRAVGDKTAREMEICGRLQSTGCGILIALGVCWRLNLEE